MPFGYQPPDEEEDSPTDFVRLGKELQELDVGPQETDAEPAVDVTDGPPAPPVPRDASPMGTPPPPRDDTLARLQRHGKAAAQRANFGRAADEFAAAFGGYKPDTSYWDHVEGQGKQGVADLLQRRGLERQGRQDASNEQLNLLRMKALLAKAQGKPAKPVVDKLAAKKELDDADAKGVHEVLLASYGPQLEGLGFDESKVRSLSKDGAHKLLDELQKSRGIEHTDTRAGNSLDESKVGHGLRRHKQEYAEEQNRVAGYEGKALSPQGAGELADTASTADQIHSKIREIKELIHQNGGLSLNKASPTMAVIKQKFTELQPLSVKAAGMGSFTEGHRELFAHAVQDPDALINLINNKRFSAQLDDLDQAADLALQAKERSLGQRKAAPKKTASAHTPDIDLEAGGADELVPMLAPNGQKRMVPKAKVAAAIAAGGKLVQP